MKRYLLLAIILIASIVRLVHLTSVPALNADEAALGYNAYSLLETGKDEHGNPWPIHFQSFNDYKPGLYVYMILPFVKFLGLTELAVRLPAVLLAISTVFVVYLLVREIERKSESSETKALLAALLLAISPWHIHFSRGGWEVNVSTFFITLGFLGLIKASRNPKYFLLSALSFVAAIYTYHAARIVIPLLGVGYIAFYPKAFTRSKAIKHIALSAFISLVLLVPLIFDIASGAVYSRAAGVGLFADPGPLSRVNEQRGEHSNYLALDAKLFHNKPVNYGLAFASNWAEHYWGEFLFLSGEEIQRNRVPETGQMHMIEIVFVALGLYSCARHLKDRRYLLWWLIVAPTAAALTFQSPHALRAHNMVIPLSIISALGLYEITHLYRRGSLQKALQVIVALALVWSFARYLHMYYLYMPKEYPYSSQYGVKELVHFVEDTSTKQVIVTDRYDQPYILFLFYLKYPPVDFQNQHVLTAPDQYGFSTVREFGRYRFESIEYDVDKSQYPGALLVGTNKEIPSEANIIQTIYGMNGYPYFRVVQN